MRTLVVISLLLVACSEKEVPGVQSKGAAARLLFEALHRNQIEHMAILEPQRADLEWIQAQPDVGDEKVNRNYDPATFALQMQVAHARFFDETRKAVEFDWERATFAGLRRDSVHGKSVQTGQIVFTVEVDGKPHEFALWLARVERGWVLMDGFSYSGPARAK